MEEIDLNIKLGERHNPNSGDRPMNGIHTMHNIEPGKAQGPFVITSRSGILVLVRPIQV